MRARTLRRGVSTAAAAATIFGCPMQTHDANNGWCQVTDTEA